MPKKTKQLKDKKKEDDLKQSEEIDLPVMNMEECEQFDPAGDKLSNITFDEEDWSTDDNPASYFD